MRIFLDGRMFYHSGIGRYSSNLYHELNRIDPAPRITLGLDEQVRQRLAEELDRSPDFIDFHAPIYSLQEQFQGSYLGWRYKRQFDLFHFPHYNIPWLPPSRTVVTCHDLIHLLFPQYFPAFKVFWASQLLKRVIQKAKRIITVSQQTKKDLLDLFPQAESKLRVVYNGVGNDFRPLPHEQVAAFKEKRQLGEYLLFVGNRKPHKNLPRLIAAYAQIRTTYPDLKLVILSQKASDNNDEVSQAISHWGVGEGIVSDQPVDTEDLVLYYNAAQLLVFPSLYEGFGLPPLEAMACGTPVVASDISSIPEVVGEAAILTNPLDLESIADGIKWGLNDSSLRDKLRKAGLDRARFFTWERTARQTLQVYQEILDYNC